MKCSRCQRDAIIFQPYSGNHLCEAHLISDIESRVKKEIRKKGGLKSGERLFVSCREPAETFALRVFLSGLLLKRTDISFVADEAEADTVLTPTCLERVAETVLVAVLEGTPDQYLSRPEKRILQPFAAIPRKEIELYAVAHNWHNVEERKSTKTDAFLTSFSETRPGTRFALKNIKDSLEEML